MIKLISTADGSSSLFIEELNETYHSRHGAIVESDFVFISEGLKHLNSLNEISVLEVGMGTGLNALLSANYALQCKKKISYTTLEPFPIDSELVNELNYHELLNEPKSTEWFGEIHNSTWETEIKLNTFFTFTKFKLKLEDYLKESTFDLVFYDAFGPHAQPELWEESVFTHLVKSMKSGGTLVTYCAQGQFKRNLKSAGFTVERLPGPPGKREMTRGTLTI